MKKKKSAKSNKKAALKKKPVPKRKPAPKPKKVKPLGKVTHYYAHIKVAIVKFNTKIKTGTELYFKGATTDFKEASKSMQFDHEPVAVAKKLNATLLLFVHVITPVAAITQS